METPSRLDLLSQILGDQEGYLGTLSEKPLPPSKVTEEKDVTEADELELKYFKLYDTFGHLEHREEYFDKKKNGILSLDKHLGQSEAVIDGLIEYLDRFQQSLSSLSSQMNSLKVQSELLNHELNNNSEFEKQLVPILTDILISPDIINSIMNDKVNVQWCDNIGYINLKLEIYEKYHAEAEAQKPEQADVEKLEQAAVEKHEHDAVVQASILEKLGPYLKDMKEIIDLLVQKIVEKIRDFLVNKIKLIRYGKNFLLQNLQKSLLELKEIYLFLYKHNQSLALDLRQGYILTVKWYYFRNFGKYLYSLEKLNLHIIDSSYLLGNLNRGDMLDTGRESRTTSTSLMSSWLRKNNTKTANLRLLFNEYLSVKERLGLLTNQDTTALPAQIAETNPMTYWLEYPFRSFNLAIIDNGTVEYLFLNEFFHIGSPEEVTRIFQLMFQPVFQMGINFTKTYLTSSANFDFYSVLIAIKLCQIFLFKLQHRKIPVMESYLNLQIITLWPKYQLITDANCLNFRKAVVKNHENSTAPHPVTNQFAMLLSSLLELTDIDTLHPSLVEVPSRAATPVDHSISVSHQKARLRSGSVSSNNEVTEPLTTSITRLSNEYENVLNKLSANVKEREKFLYNNYIMLYTVVEKYAGPVAESEKQHFKLLIEAHKAAAQ